MTVTKLCRYTGSGSMGDKLILLTTSFSSFKANNVRSFDVNQGHTNFGCCLLVTPGDGSCCSRRLRSVSSTTGLLPSLPRLVTHDDAPPVLDLRPLLRKDGIISRRIRQWWPDREHIAPVSFNFAIRHLLISIHASIPLPLPDRNKTQRPTSSDWHHKIPTFYRRLDYQRPTLPLPSHLSTAAPHYGFRYHLLRLHAQRQYVPPSLSNSPLLLH
jgi:hypothetical protein